MATANGRFEGVLVRGMRVDDIRANKTIIGQRRAGDMQLDHARQRQGRDRLAARRHAWRLSGKPDQPVEPGRALDGRRHRPAR